MKLTKSDKILVIIAFTLFLARVIYFFSYRPRVAITGDMIIYLDLVEIITYMYMFVLFVLLVSVMTKLELAKRDGILVSIILGLFFVQIVHGMLDQLHIVGYAVFTDYWLPVSFLVLFVWSWLIMIFNAIGIVFEQFSWGVPLYTFFSIIAWISLFVLIKYTKGMKLLPRIVYLYIIPALIMSLAYLYRIPLH